MKRSPLRGAAERQAIDANIATPYTNWFNKVIDDTERRNMAITQKLGNQTIYKLPPGELAQWKKKVEPVIANWEKRTPDGARAGGLPQGDRRDP